MINESKMTSKMLEEATRMLVNHFDKNGLNTLDFLSYLLATLSTICRELEISQAAFEDIINNLRKNYKFTLEFKEKQNE